MSREALPITNTQFAEAIKDLPIENIYAKAYEINNSIAHLTQSNQTLQEYSDSIKNDTSLDEWTRRNGDRDCLEAIEENEVVIKRQRDRVGLLKAEVERRGARWHEADPQASGPTVNGHVTNGDSTSTAGANMSNAEPSRPNDGEARRGTTARSGTNTTDDEDGLYL